jgi:hypothetical protein
MSLKTLPFLGKTGVYFENHKFRQNQKIVKQILTQYEPCHFFSATGYWLFSL